MKKRIDWKRVRWTALILCLFTFWILILNTFCFDDWVKSGWFSLLATMLCGFFRHAILALFNLPKAIILFFYHNGEKKKEGNYPLRTWRNVD